MTTSHNHPLVGGSPHARTLTHTCAHTCPVGLAQGTPRPPTPCPAPRGPWPGPGGCECRSRPREEVAPQRGRQALLLELPVVGGVPRGLRTSAVQGHAQSRRPASHCGEGAVGPVPASPGPAGELARKPGHVDHHEKHSASHMAHAGRPHISEWPQGSEGGHRGVWAQGHGLPRHPQPIGCRNLATGAHDATEAGPIMCPFYISLALCSVPYTEL